MKLAFALATSLALFAAVPAALAAAPAAGKPAAKPAGGALNGKAVITDARLAADKDGKSATTSFKADAKPVYCVGKLKGPAGTKVSASWVAVKVGKLPPNKVILAKDWTSAKPNQAFFFMLDAKGKAKPAGDYKVELSVAGKPSKTLTFTIK